MQRRLIYILAAAAALLAFVVAVGAVLLRGDGGGDAATRSGADKRSAGSVQRTVPAAGQATRVGQPATPAIVLAPSLAAPSATAIVVSIDSVPQTASPQAVGTTELPLVVLLTAIPVPAQPSSSTPLSQVLSLPAPTDVPVPPRQPERVGGPVSVPHNHDGPRWVTLQIGHLRSNSFPDELAHLRNSTGASSGGVTEVEIGRASCRGSEWITVG